MADARDQVARVLDGSQQPLDVTAESPLEPDTAPDRTRQFRSVNFSRMKRSWTGDDAAALGDIMHAADQAINAYFARAIRLIEHLQEIAQIPVTEQGEVQFHPNGRRKVRVDEHGDAIEDWSRLSETDRSNALFTLTTHMYEWERIAVRMWGEAMFAKAIWEQAFSEGFRVLPGQQISGKPTIDDRTQVGHAHSAQDRYFGIFCSMLSRQADSLVRNLVRIQRLLENTSGG